MFALIHSEYIKGKRSFGRKSLVLFPLFTTLIAIFLMGGQLTQIGAINWWYMLLMPAMVALICVNLISPEKKSHFFNISILPFPKTKCGKLKCGLV